MPDKKVQISGWRFENVSKIHSKKIQNVLSLLISHQYDPSKFKQMSFNHITYVESISEDKFVDTQSDLHYVSKFYYVL